MTQPPRPLLTVRVLFSPYNPPADTNAPSPSSICPTRFTIQKANSQTTDLHCGNERHRVCAEQDDVDVPGGGREAAVGSVGDIECCVDDEGCGMNATVGDDDDGTNSNHKPNNTSSNNHTSSSSNNNHTSSSNNHTSSSNNNHTSSSNNNHTPSNNHLPAPDLPPKQHQQSILQRLLAHEHQLNPTVTERGPTFDVPYVPVSQSWFDDWAKYIDGSSNRCPSPVRTAQELADTRWIPFEAWKAFSCWFGGEPPVVRHRSASVIVDDSALERYVDRELEALGGFPSYWNKEWNMSLSRHENKVDEVCVVCNATESVMYVCEACVNVKYCSVGCQSTHWSVHRKFCSTQPNRTPSHRFGLTGINNLGNTCFMNSAVQCLSHTWPLTEFFMRKSFVRDLNRENSFGSQGHFAVVWYSLLQQLWLGDSKVINPTQLKIAIGKLPGSENRFRGFMQHDAQELLVYLLDTLHEDLNLVTNKPYVPQNDDEKVPMAVRAAQAWVGNWKRDRSIISFLFQGQSMSSLECPSCHHKSITFEPFVSLPLAIPEKLERTFIVTFIPRLKFSATTKAQKKSGKKNRKGKTQPKNKTANITKSFKVETLSPRLRLAVTVPSGGNVYHIRAKVAAMTKTRGEDLWFVEMARHQIWRQLHDEDRVARLAPTTAVTVFELDPEPEVPNMDAEAPTTFVILHRRRHGGLLCGSPSVLGVDHTTTFREIRQKLCSFLSAVTMSDPDKIDNSDQLLRDTKQLPLYLTTSKGFNQQRTPECFGGSSAFPDDDRVVFESIDILEQSGTFFLAIDWDELNELGVHIKFADSQLVPLHEEVRNHASATKHLDQLRKQSGGRQASAASQKDVVSLDQCLQKFLNKERLDAGNTWYCTKCKTDQRAIKSMVIRRLPHVLVIFLKRFEHRTYQVGGRVGRSKLTSLVDFPISGLNMNKYIAHDGDEEGAHAEHIYDLFAVINHYGNMGHGHYTAFVASEMDSETGSKSWHELDDNTCADVRPEDICTNAAYVLFYRKRQIAVG